MLQASKELRGLKVPDWMEPTSDKRGRVSSVMSFSAIQGLSLGWADITAQLRELRSDNDIEKDDSVQSGMPVIVSDDILDEGSS